MAKLITGILSHVDAGKTTLSEALLYTGGAIRKLGRVDSQDTFLDTQLVEKQHGITVFAKQAVLSDKITLIDTPGHVDFSTEMERTLSVLDAAILLINGADGIQSHTKTLWALLQKHHIPTLIFVNKTDIPSVNKQLVFENLCKTFSRNIVDFSDTSSDIFYEKISSTSDELTEKYLQELPISSEEISMAINQRKAFPLLFGSALRLQGIDKLISVLDSYFSPQNTNSDFGCIVYKTSSDKSGSRLSHIKVTGGILKVKDYLGEEKINEIRVYNGDKFENVQEISAGNICTVTGLKTAKAGSVFGTCSLVTKSTFEPAIIYSVKTPDVTTSRLLEILRQLEDEMPELKVDFKSQQQEVHIMLIGELQAEIIKEIVKERFSVNITFTDGKVAYKETIAKPVLGAGHYEPLRHYAEVHVLLTPLSRGSGMKFVSDLPVNELDTNWQRLIYTHMTEKQHLGVLTQSPLTDIEIKLVAAKAHLKHTEGGDFRQATYRAIRQGLMKAKSLLLEPVYKFEITVPKENTGKVLSDIQRMSGTCTIEETTEEFCVLSGHCPVSEMKNYITEIRAFTKGRGTLTAVVDGYQECHNTDTIVEQEQYNPDSDQENPAFSIFCSHGAGFAVPWQDVDKMSHIQVPEI